MSQGNIEKRKIKMSDAQEFATSLLKISKSSMESVGRTAFFCGLISGIMVGGMTVFLIMKKFTE